MRLRLLLCFCLFLVMSSPLLAQKAPKTLPLRIKEEKLLTESIYRKDYQALKPQCETPDATPYQFSLHQNLFATALFNDLAQKFKLGISLQTKIGFSGNEIAQIEVLWEGSRFGFYDCNYPEKTPIAPSGNRFVGLDEATELLKISHSHIDDKLRYHIYPYENKNAEDWDFFMVQITPDAESRMLFFAQKSEGSFTVRHVNTLKKTAREVVYDLNTGIKTAEGELQIIAEKREKIRSFDPFTFQEIEQELVTEGSYVQRKGTWKFYAPDGNLLKEEKY